MLLFILVKLIPKCSVLLKGSPTKQVGESKGEVDSGKQKTERKSSAKSVSREAIRSAKCDKQDKNQVKGDKPEKNKTGGKLTAEKPERARSGSTKRKLSRVEKMPDAKCKCQPTTYMHGY